jgi:uncharacterized protein
VNQTNSQVLEQRTFMTRVYGWMTIGLLVSSACAVAVAYDPRLAGVVIENRWIFFTLLIAELLLVSVIAGLIQKISAVAAGGLFILYSLLNGATLSVIFSVYQTSSIVSIFFVTAGMFAVMSVYGYFTKTDLTRIGNLLFMALAGLVIAMIANLFIQSNTADLALSAAGVIIFVGLTAYDTQKIKALNVLGDEGTDEDKKEAIYGALTLYLDFINLFLDLLRLFGKRR